MKRARDSKTALPERSSARLRHIAEGRAGISRHDHVPLEMFLEIVGHLDLSRHLAVFGQLALVSTAFARAVAARLTLPKWLREIDLRLKYPGTEFIARRTKEDLQLKRNLFVQLYRHETIRQLMKWDTRQAMSMSLWDRFSQFCSPQELNFPTRRIGVCLQDHGEKLMPLRIYVGKRSFQINIELADGRYFYYYNNTDRRELTPEKRNEFWALLEGEKSTGA